MVDYRKHRQEVESLYEDTLTVESGKPTHSKDETGESIISYEVLYEDEPCRISNMIANENNKEMYVAIAKGARLYTAPEVMIPDGSTVKVTRNELTFTYRRCELQRHFKSHNEYALHSEKVAL